MVCRLVPAQVEMVCVNMTKTLHQFHPILSKSAASSVCYGEAKQLIISSWSSTIRPQKQFLDYLSSLSFLLNYLYYHWAIYFYLLQVLISGTAFTFAFPCHAGGIAGKVWLSWCLPSRWHLSRRTASLDQGFHSTVMDNTKQTLILGFSYLKLEFIQQVSLFVS